MVSKSCSRIFFVLTVALFCAVCLIPCSEVHARDVRGYITPPDGTAGVLFYSYQRSADEQYSKGNKVTNNADFDMNLHIVRPVYYKEICGYMTSVQMLLPFGNGSVTTPVGKFTASGFADPTLLLGFWPISNKEEQMWLGVAEYITMPIATTKTIVCLTWEQTAGLLKQRRLL